MKHNWIKAEKYFMNNDVTLKFISQKFVIPYQSVRRYAANNEWHKKRFVTKNKSEIKKLWEDSDERISFH